MPQESVGVGVRRAGRVLQGSKSWVRGREEVVIAVVRGRAGRAGGVWSVLCKAAGKLTWERGQTGFGGLKVDRLWRSLAKTEETGAIGVE